MKHKLVGALYIAAGLACDLFFIGITGAMLAITTPIYSYRELLVPPLFLAGPSLLILAGVATIADKTRLWLVCTITAAVVVTANALWAVPRIGWRDSLWLLVEPEAASYLLASLLLLVVKRRWIGAAVGATICASFFLYASAGLVGDLVFGTAILDWAVVWILGPSVLLVLCLVSAICVRTS